MRPLLPSDPVRIGRYELDSMLGSGGMGTVYFGRSPGGRPAAIKVINQGYLTHPEALARFRREADMLRSLRSAYTAALIDCELRVAPYWMATEYIPGPTLSAAVKDEGPFAPEVCVRMLAALAEGLSDIHRHGVCHRDLKPPNVILSATGPQLIDFGIARGLEQDGLTLTGITMGTPGYIAPELLDSDDLTPAADIFALGASLAYAATGRKPYGDGTMENIYLRLMREDIDLAGAEPGLSDLIRWCVAKDRTARPSPAQLIEHCRRWRAVNAPTRSVPNATAPPRRTAIPAGGTAGTGSLGDSGQGLRAPSGGPLPNGAVPAADHGKPLQWLIGIVAAVLAVLTVLTLLGFALYELNGGAATRAYPERDDPGQRTTNVTAA